LSRYFEQPGGSAKTVVQYKVVEHRFSLTQIKRAWDFALTHK
jgi:hypothetical protein